MTQDSRIVRTRERLCAAAIELLRSKESRDVSISELARAAGVSRPTIYQHYPDLRALYTDALATHLDSVISPEPVDLESKGPPSTLVDILSEFAAHRTFYRRLVRASANFDVDGDSSPLQPLMNVLLPKVAIQLDGVNPRLADDLARYVISGAVGVLAAWLAEEDAPYEDIGPVAARLWGLIRISLNGDYDT